MMERLTSALCTIFGMLQLNQQTKHTIPTDKSVRVILWLSGQLLMFSFGFVCSLTKTCENVHFDIFHFPQLTINIDISLLFLLRFSPSVNTTNDVQTKVIFHIAKAFFSCICCLLQALWPGPQIPWNSWRPVACSKCLT